MNKDLRVTESGDAADDTLYELVKSSSFTRRPYISAPTNIGATIIVRRPSPLMNSFWKMLSVRRSCLASGKALRPSSSRTALSRIDAGGIQSAVPLFYSQHIQAGKVIFPIGKENEYIVTDQAGLLQKNKNYLFVKRFTAKEEHRRLQCGVYLSRKFSAYSLISTQNKINFIDGATEISECVVFGLYVIFNSTFYDCYYRILNGSTQVNSTEVNSMPMPPMNIIEAMGKQLIAVRDMSENSCDTILRSYL